MGLLRVQLGGTVWGRRALRYRCLVKSAVGDIRRRTFKPSRRLCLMIAATAADGQCTNQDPGPIGGAINKVQPISPVTFLEPTVTLPRLALEL